MSPQSTPAAIALIADDLIRAGLSKGLTHKALKEALARAMSSKEELASTPSTVFTIIVDYSKSMRSMVKDGNYDRVNPNIAFKNLPLVGEGRVEVTLELLHFDRIISTEKALEEIKKRGLVAARIEHLLAFGAAHPELQREFPILALGSVWQNPYSVRYVPSLWGGRSRRLDMYWSGTTWVKTCRFLAACPAVSP